MELPAAAVVGAAPSEYACEIIAGVTNVAWHLSQPPLQSVTLPPAGASTF
jgi:hypothetical protein